jgi:hypothetical protein
MSTTVTRAPLAAVYTASPLAKQVVPSPQTTSAVPSIPSASLPIATIPVPTNSLRSRYGDAAFNAVIDKLYNSNKMSAFTIAQAMNDCPDEASQMASASSLLIAMDADATVTGEGLTWAIINCFT